MIRKLAIAAGAPCALTLALVMTAALALGGGTQPSAAATTDIPPAYLELYQAAATTCPGLSWTVLAAIGKVETDHGRNIRLSSAGAEGPMQFLPATFAIYGVDGDGDGLINIGDPADAIYSAANMLCADGAGTGEQGLRDAIFAYNHNLDYVDQVLQIASGYGLEGPPTRTGPPVVAVPPDASPAARAALTFALSPPVYGSAYLYGGTGPLYDCSGLTQAAYAAAGISLPRTSQQQWLAFPIVPADALEPGDLVFFNPDGAGMPDHVGIYVSNGYMVDDPHTGASERVEPIAGFGTYMGAVRP